MINVINRCCSEQSLSYVGRANGLVAMILLTHTVAHCCGHHPVVGNGQTKLKQSVHKSTLPCHCMDSESHIDSQWGFSGFVVMNSSTSISSTDIAIVVQQLCCAKAA